MPWQAAAVGMGAQLLGGYFGKKSEKALQRRRKRKYLQMMKIYDQIKDYQSEAFGSMYETLRQRPELIEEGYNNARAELQRMGEASRQAVRDQGQMAAGQGMQNLISSGLYGSSENVNLQRAVASDTARGIAGVNEGLAGAFAGLETERTQAQSAAMGDLANFYGQQYAAQAQLLQDRAAITGAYRGIASPQIVGGGGYEMGGGTGYGDWFGGMADIISEGFDWS